MNENLHYAAIESHSGKLLGYYHDDDVHPKDCRMLELTEQEWYDSMDANANYLKSGRLVYVEPDLDSDEVKQGNLEMRKSAYINESDPLFMEWQFDETDESKERWKNKVAEIKQRFPIK